MFTKNYKFQCEWNITVKTGRTIKLITQDFNLGHRDNGCKNYLMIRNGKFPDSPLLGKFCGSDSPNELESFSNHLYIKYSGMDNVGVSIPMISPTQMLIE